MRRGATLVLQVLAAAAVAAGAGSLAARAANDSSETTTIPATAGDRAASGVPTCRELGVDAESRREVTCATATAVLTFVNGAHRVEMPGFAGRARSVKAFEAATEEGRARRRMRVAVALEASATGDRPVLGPGDEPAVYLSIGGNRQEPDGSFREQEAFDLESAVPAGETRRGEVRFELAGEQSERFLEEGGQLALRPVAGDTPRRLAIVRLRAPRQLRSLAGESGGAGSAEQPGGDGAATTPATTTP